MTLCLPHDSPHIFRLQIFCSGPPVPSGVLVSHIDSKPVSPSVSPKTCSAECTLCAQVHTAVYSPPPTIQTLRMHPCTAAAESSTTPTQYCAMTAKQPSPAAPHTAAHPRPSPCTCILTHVIRIPNTVSLAYSTQDKPVTVPSRYYIWSVSEIARLLYTRVPPCPRKSSCPVCPILPPSFRSGNSVASSLPMKHDSY